MNGSANADYEMVDATQLELYNLLLLILPPSKFFIYHIYV
jgi:hypothetical protein